MRRLSRLECIMASAATTIPALQAARTSVSGDGAVIQIDLETSAGERLRCGLTPEGAVNLATALLTARKAAADRRAKKPSVS
jgi:hypothetical protein